ncbi:protein ACCELERATED CELL DEATH 6-like [Herrania umbratica]|uniref:Protein ACCELERATED CELL DEATH 6-like n=1 Tax=Herrania umbratica TaxID=108875 RepID=A0A6J1AVE7_9ROSI|nr:protein ACCELERATED CELL DEATH 6-like [Herrania umbratica]
MDPSSSISSELAIDEQAMQGEITTRLESELYKAAFDGNVEAFDVCPGSLHCLVTPNRNTVLHVYLASQNYKITLIGLIPFPYISFKAPAKILRSANFVGQILNRSPSLLLKPNAKGEIPLHIAARFGHANIVELLIKRAKAEYRDLENGIEPAKQMLRLTDKEKNTALHKAVRYGHLDAVHALIREDPDFPYSVNKSGESPLYIAARRGYNGLVTVIFDKCESVNHDGPCGRTALHAAVMAPDIRSTREILRKRKNLTKAADENGQTPLHYAAHFGYHRIVKLLLECDESAAYIADKEKMTPLLLRARQGYYVIVMEIINHCPGCCEIVDKKGWNFCHFAAVSSLIIHLYDMFLPANNLYSCRRFLDEEDIHGNTPLQVLAASRELSTFIVHTIKDDVVTTSKENLDSKKKEQISQLLNEVGTGEVAGSAVNPLRHNTIDLKGFDKAREARSVVAALIATVTFAAAIALPGGYKSDQGTAILSHNTAFKVFVIADAIAMVFSLLAINFNYLSATPIIVATRRRYGAFQFSLMAIFGLLGEVALVVAFVASLYAVLKSSLILAISACTVILGFYFFYFWLYYFVMMLDY